MGPTNYVDPRLKKRMAALAELEGGLPGLDFDVETPAGQLNVSRAPLRPIDPENLEVAGPVSALGQASGGRPPPVPPPVDPRDVELDDATALDQDAMERRLFETATRQLVGGLTRTPTAPTLTQETHKKSDLLGQRAKARMDALRELEAGNNAARTTAYLKANESAGPRADRKLTLEEEEAKRREERAKTKAAADAAVFEETKRHHKQTEGIGWTGVKRADEKATRDEERLSLKTDAVKPRDDWEPIEAGKPTFRDAAQGKAFDDSVAAMGAIRNHRDHVLHEVEALKKAKTPGEVDIIVGRLNAQMGALASKLRDAEGLNNTDASNQAVENMLSLSHGSAVNWKNVLNEGRLPAILDAAVSSGAANLETLGASRNLRRKKGGGKTEAPAAQRKTLKDGRVVEKHADGLWYPVEE